MKFKTNMETCCFHIEWGSGLMSRIVLCGRPTKYITPKYKKEGEKPVCGIHRNSVDKFHERIGSGLKCKPYIQKGEVKE